MKMFLRRLRRALGAGRQDLVARRDAREVNAAARFAAPAGIDVATAAPSRPRVSGSGRARRIPCISEPCPDIGRALERLRAESRLSARDLRVGATR